MTPTERLIEKLEGAGYEVTHLSVVKGFWRRQDVYRWEAYVKRPDGLKCIIRSWDTITDCARRPLKIALDEQFDNCWELKAWCR